MRDPKERIAALAACFDEETFCDIEAVILDRHASRVLLLQARVKELRDAGLSSQADELLGRINAAMPQEAPALPALPQPQPTTTATNGTVLSGGVAAPLPRPRGRPRKIQDTLGGPTS